MHWRSRAAALFAAAVMCAASGAQGTPKKAGPSKDDAAFAGAEVFEELKLQIKLPAAAELTKAETPQALAALWRGTLASLPIELAVAKAPARKLALSSPEDALEEFDSMLQRLDETMQFESHKSIGGPYGVLPYAVWRKGKPSGSVTGEKKQSLTAWMLAGLSSDFGYAVIVTTPAAPTPEIETAVLDFFRTGIRYVGAVPDAKWSPKEAQARWLADAPPELKDELRPPIRTAHYIIFSNSSGGDAFAKKMEECYVAIKKVYPFDEPPAARLMPVFLFRTPEQYYAYYARIANISLDAARKSKGHAWRDYYATYYESPGDPVHVHEATHQIFANRLRLGGGGSWFQEGVAEYMSTKKADLAGTVVAVKKGRHVPLAEFIKIPSLLYSAGESRKGGSEATDHYHQAALFIEFARESPFGKAHFDKFLAAIGRVPRNDAEQINAAFQQVYGKTVAQVDAEFQKYCEAR